MSVSRLRHPTDRRSSQNYFCLFALDLLSRASLLGSLYGFQGTSGSRTSVLSPGCLPLDSLALLTSVRTPRLSPRFRSLVSLVRQLCYYTSPASFCQHLFPFFFPPLFYAALPSVLFIPLPEYCNSLSTFITPFCPLFAHYIKKYIRKFRFFCKFGTVGSRRNASLSTDVGASAAAFGADANPFLFPGCFLLIYRKYFRR